MKEGWKMVKLGKIVSTSNGLWKGKKPPYINIAVIRNTNFTKDCKLRLDDIEYIDAEEKQFLTRKLEYGDIIIEKSGGSDKQPVGRPVLFNIKEGNFSYSNFTSRIRIIDNKIIDSSFLQKALYNHYIKGSTFPLQSNTTGIHNLDFKGYLELDIPLPPLEEQHRIVSILDASFEKIDALKKNAEENLKNAKALFQQVLAQELKPKDGGDYRKLDSLYLIKTGKLNSNQAVKNGKYPFFTCSREIFAINEYAFDCEAVLLAGNNASGDFNVKHYKGKFNAYQRTYVIQPKTDLAGCRLLYYVLLLYLSELKSLSLGANTKFLKLGMIENIKVPILNSNEHRIVATLDTLSEKCRRLEQVAQQTIRECDALKQSILRQAFSGEL